MGEHEAVSPTSDTVAMPAAPPSQVIDVMREQLLIGDDAATEIYRLIHAALRDGASPSG